MIEVKVVAISDKGRSAIQDYLDRRPGLLVRQGLRSVRGLGFVEETNVMCEEPLTAVVTISGRGRARSFLEMLSPLQLSMEVSKKFRESDFKAVRDEDYVLEVRRG